MCQKGNGDLLDKVCRPSSSLANRTDPMNFIACFAGRRAVVGRFWRWSSGHAEKIRPYPSSVNLWELNLAQQCVVFKKYFPLLRPKPYLPYRELQAIATLYAASDERSAGNLNATFWGRVTASSHPVGDQAWE